jgi:hypothetical protein
VTDTSEWNWEARYVMRPPEADLAQGDLIDTKRSGVGDRFSRARWFVVLNQPCDLARQQEFKKGAPRGAPLVSRARTLLVAPAVPLTEYFSAAIASGKKLVKSGSFEKLLLWNDDWAAYIPPGPGLDVDLVVVLEELYTLEAWHEVEGLPDLGGYDEVQRARILGLASPWAERLGWMVGRQFARVGTPDPPRSQLGELLAAVADRVCGQQRSEPKTPPE